MPTLRKCSVADCNNPIECKQLCNLHYKRLRRKGSLDRTIREDGAGTVRGGYVFVMIDGVRKNEHTFLAEKALGKELLIGAEVHHVDGDRENNSPSNLVICPDKLYHQLLHKRQRALEDCGNANWRQCRVCRVYDSMENLKGCDKRDRVYHTGDRKDFCNFHRGI